MSLLPKTMKQWVLASRPVGVVKHDDFALQQADVPNISENEVLLKTLYLGVAPVMQRYMIGASIAVARYWGGTIVLLFSRFRITYREFRRGQCLIPLL